MDFRIADTFLDSLARLTGEEQKLVKTTVFDLQVNPTNPGHQFHRLDRARDRNFWSVRVGSDIRLIVHRTAAGLLICHVDHHDKAYRWAERRRLEVHPRTGAAQLVELRETVQEIVVHRHVDAPGKPYQARRLFENIPTGSLLGFGVPTEWVNAVRDADEDGFFRLADHLPAEASQALLEIAAGGGWPPTAPLVVDYGESLALLESSDHLLGDALEPSLARPSVDADTALASALEHPDAQRRFRLVHTAAELERALDAPWDRWTVFLHPDQRAVVEREQKGPARVTGSAGTGKTIVALHRAVFLARQHPEARVLMATFDEPLANALGIRLRRLVGNEPQLADRIDVSSLDAAGLRLYQAVMGRAPRLVTRPVLLGLLQAAAASAPNLRINLAFLVSEWDQVVDAGVLESWEEYRDVPRLGRRVRLREDRRLQLWGVYEKVLEALRSRGEITHATMFIVLARALAGRNHPPYDFVIVDEAQDISMAQLRFLSALGSHRPDALFFAGDIGQRIFQQPFSWKAMGVDVRGRSRTLRVNYRTSHQIRMQADRLLAPEVTDADGIVDPRNTTISLFNGPAPVVQSSITQEEEIASVAQWLAERIADPVAPHEIGIFVRSEAQLPRARAAAEKAGLSCKILDHQLQVPSGFASVGTMHLAKGLEFKAVVIMGCDDEVVPLQARIETVGEDGDLQEVYDSERQLLYVACTRAREVLLVTGVTPVSEFLDDLSK
jgi:mRNA-degrading endonuclease RelE of RelBE toxin-antitoxin system